MIESDDNVNYEMAYIGACVELDVVSAKYIKLRDAARRVCDTDNKYLRDDALDELWQLVRPDS